MVFIIFIKSGCASKILLFFLFKVIKNGLLFYYHILLIIYAWMRVFLLDFQIFLIFSYDLIIFDKIESQMVKSLIKNKAVKKAP